jgi:hypothetical protein
MRWRRRLACPPGKLLVFMSPGSMESSSASQTRLLPLRRGYLLLEHGSGHPHAAICRKSCRQIKACAASSGRRPFFSVTSLHFWHPSRARCHIQALRRYSSLVCSTIAAHQKPLLCGEDALHQPPFGRCCVGWLRQCLLASSSPTVWRGWTERAGQCPADTQSQWSRKHLGPV